MPEIQRCASALRGRQRLNAAGTALAADAVQIVSSDAALARLVLQVGASFDAQHAIAVKANGLGTGVEAERLFAGFCRRLGTGCRRAGLPTAALEIGVSWATVDPEVAWALRHEHLDGGPLNLCCDDPGSAAGAWPDFWQALWQLRAEPTATVSCWPVVTSRCPLLAAEHAGALLPHTGIQAPAQSAWFVADISLTEHVSDVSSPGTSLEQALIDAVESADVAHDEIEWPNASLRHDAWFNRRLAINVDGIGELAKRQGLDPRCHHTLLTLDALLRRIADTVERTSRRIATTRETLPSINSGNPCQRLPAGSHRDAWSQRWARAVTDFALGHRNLLLLSPWSLFPDGEPDLCYANLLPLLKHADVCGFSRRPSIEAWKPNEFKHFYERILAVMQHRQAQAAVAERL